VGGMIAVMFARFLQRSRWRVVSLVMSVIGFIIFVEQAEEVVFAMLFK